MSQRRDIEDLLRDAAPQVLAAVVRRFGDFADAEDAVQEAMLAATQQWPRQGTPDNPVGWLIHVASRRMVDQARSETARRDRQALAAAREPRDPQLPADHDDTLTLIFMSCHPELTPASAIALTLRAVGGLTTTEIANAFLVPEATMAQRISRAKQTIKASATPFRMPSGEEWTERLRSVLHVLYLIFNEGYLTSGGPELARTELSGEAIRLARIVRRALPDDPVAGEELLALGERAVGDDRRADAVVDDDLGQLWLGQRLGLNQLAALGEPLVHPSLELDVGLGVRRRPGTYPLARDLGRSVVLKQHEPHLVFSFLRLPGWARSPSVGAERLVSTRPNQADSAA